MKFCQMKIHEISSYLKKNLIDKGIKFHLNSSVTDILKKNNFELKHKNLKTGKDLNN